LQSTVNVILSKLISCRDLTGHKITIKCRSGTRQQVHNRARIAYCKAITELGVKLENELTAELEDNNRTMKSFT